MLIVPNQYTPNRYQPILIHKQKVGGMKGAMCQRMGLRLEELGWQGNELLDLYCRARTQIIACDEYFRKEPVIDVEGKVSPAARFYLNAIKVSISALEALRAIVAEMAREDDRFGDAIEALAQEGQKARNAKALVGG